MRVRMEMAFKVRKMDVITWTEDLGGKETQGLHHGELLERHRRSRGPGEPCQSGKQMESHRSLPQCSDLHARSKSQIHVASY